MVSAMQTTSSTSDTLATTPQEKDITTPFHNPHVQPASVIEFIASRSSNSSALYVYDLAEQVGFGTQSSKYTGSAPVIRLQTRAGAGLGLVGRLSEGTSQDGVSGSVLTALTSIAGLGLMLPALVSLPPATPHSRLVLQVPALSPNTETFALSPSLATLATALPILPRNITILLSSTPEEAVDFAQLAYSLTSSHVVHIFDHYSATREIGHTIAPPRGTTAGPIREVFKHLGHTFFRYHGGAAAETVLVVLNGPLAHLALALACDSVGVFVVAVVRPWDEDALLRALPDNVKTLHVIEEVPNGSSQGPVYADIFGAFIGKPVAVHSKRVVPSQVNSFVTKDTAFADYISHLLPAPATSGGALPSTFKKVLLFSSATSTLSAVPHIIEDTYLTHKSVSARLLVDHDILSKPDGLSASRILLFPKREETKTHYLPVSTAIPLDADNTKGDADFVAVLDQTLLKSHAVLNYAKSGSSVLIVTDWQSAEVEANLPPSVLQTIVDRQLRLFSIDAKDVASHFVPELGPLNSAIQNLVVHFAFLRLYLGAAATEQTVFKVARGAWGVPVEGIQLGKVSAHTWAAFEEVVASHLSQAEGPPGTPLKAFTFSAVAISQDDAEEDTAANSQAHLGTWHEAAKHIIFPKVFVPPAELLDETFSQEPSLRPELPERTYLITCTVNRRLTPLEYDRNVFHLEFETRGTGLQYAIGEALGVHGWNDEEEVLEFCDWYGVDPNRLVTIPIPGGDGRMHTRTTFQSLQQQIDLFGRPPKSFYTDLAAYATGSKDRHALLFIGAPEGSATLKKLSEKDTVRFVDVLKMFPSARPGIEVLCELIGDIKPRHYSIASSQAVVGDRVDLLVVTVDWMTAGGSPRFGQCTRYLAGLRVGQKVTVSIKPSVMKLPPSNTQPLIMAGLGTGAAPFRAFLQHRAFIRSTGEQVGPVYYYFGSRHQSQEYLYGEEIEAFILDNTITKAGLAFSRDGPKKVYIQHKMLEDAKVLANMLKSDEGVFYLCGPTWPVPDVYEALVEALTKHHGETRESADAYLESLKEEERYVLEVY